MQPAQTQDPYTIVTQFMMMVPRIHIERSGPLNLNTYNSIYDALEQLNDDQLEQIAINAYIAIRPNATREELLNGISNYFNKIHHTKYLGFGAANTPNLRDLDRQVLDRIIWDPILMWTDKDARNVDETLSRTTEQQLRNYLNGIFNDNSPVLDNMNKDQLINYFDRIIINRYHQFSNNIKNYILNELRNRRPLQLLDPEANTSYLSSSELREILNQLGVQYSPNSEKWQLVNYLNAYSDQLKPVEQQNRLLQMFQQLII